jgi:hypothetical protein
LSKKISGDGKEWMVVQEKGNLIYGKWFHFLGMKEKLYVWEQRFIAICCYLTE